MSEPSVPPPPPAAPAGGSENRTLMLVLSYLGLLSLVPLLVEKKDKEVQWHAKNGLVLFLFFVALSIVISIVGMVPVVGCFVMFLHIFVWIGYLVVIILGIVKATKGERFVLPGISQFADKF